MGTTSEPDCICREAGLPALVANWNDHVRPTLAEQVANGTPVRIHDVAQDLKLVRAYANGEPAAPGPAELPARLHLPTCPLSSGVSAPV